MFYHDEGDGSPTEQELYDGEAILETWHPFDLEGAEIIDAEGVPADSHHLYDFDADYVVASAAARSRRQTARRHSRTPRRHASLPAPAAAPHPEAYFDHYDDSLPEAEEWSPERTARVMSGSLELATVAFLLFLVAAVLLDRGERPAVAAGAPDQLPAATLPAAAMPPPSPTPVPAPAVIAPYAPGTYWVTQGHHGTSYGHLAIDLSAGKGAPVLSPIGGTVVGNYVDVWDNTTLVIENHRFRVTMLHGDYTARVGDIVSQGQIVGTESNRGYTKDMQGRSCRNRDCGYHTHLNIYDRSAGRNADPFSLLDIRR